MSTIRKVVGTLTALLLALGVSAHAEGPKKKKKKAATESTQPATTKSQTNQKGETPPEDLPAPMEEDPQTNAPSGGGGW